MRRFITKTFLLLSPVITIGFLLEILIRQMPNDYKIKKEYLDEHAGEVETLILGSSHSFYGVNPAYLRTKSFNAAFNSQTLEYDYQILKQYEHRLKDLKYVILPVSYFSLFNKLEDIQDWRISYYVIYYGMSSSSIGDYSEVLSSKLDFNIRRLIRNYIENRPNVLSSKSGWAKRFYSIPSKNLDESGRKAAKEHTFNTGKYFKENLFILQSIVSLCERHDIELLLFTPPAYRSYVSHLNDHQLALTIKTVNKIVKDHENVVYYNWLKNSSFTSSDYYDADHLNKQGAEKLSVLINEVINNR